MSDTAYVIETGRKHLCRDFRQLHPECLESKDELCKALATHSKRADLWIAPSPQAVFWLAEAVLNTGAPPRGLLLVLSVVPASLASLFSHAFDRFVQAPSKMLSVGEVATVLSREDRAEFCLGGTIEPKANMASFICGDLSTLNVPLSTFVQRGDGPVPELEQFGVIDHGRTLRFGKYEAAFDAVLYEWNPEYRRRIKKLRFERDSTLGGSLRRLRKQRGLRLSDMGRLEKTVARIERGEVSRPRKASLAAIAQMLDVAVEQIADF